MDYEERLQQIEKSISNLQDKVNNLASRSDMIAMLNVRQMEIEKLEAKLGSLKTQVELLQVLNNLET